MTLPGTFNGNSKGFTAIELIIVIAITVVLLAAVAPLYGNFQSSSQLNDAAAQIEQTLRTARARSAARLNNDSHGVKFFDDRYVLYQGSSYGARALPYDRETILGDALVLTTDVPLGDIHFSKGIGTTTIAGTITVAHDTGGTRAITISQIGVVE